MQSMHIIHFLNNFKDLVELFCIVFRKESINSKRCFAIKDHTLNC